MPTSKLTVVKKFVSKGQDRLELRHGEKGTGKLVFSVEYATSNHYEFEQAKQSVMDAAHKTGIPFQWDIQSYT